MPIRTIHTAPETDAEDILATLDDYDDDIRGDLYGEDMFPDDIIAGMGE